MVFLTVCVLVAGASAASSSSSGDGILPQNSNMTLQEQIHARIQASKANAKSFYPSTSGAETRQSQSQTGVPATYAWTAEPSRFQNWAEVSQTFIPPAGSTFAACHEMSQYEYIAVLDFEANCVFDPSRDQGRRYQYQPGDLVNEGLDPRDFPQEIVEFPTVILGRDRTVPPGESGEYRIIDEFRKLVKTKFYPVTPFCTNLTSITREEVERDGEDFPSVWRQWNAFMERYPNALLVTYGDWDLRKMLPQQLGWYSPAEVGEDAVPSGANTSTWCNVKERYADALRHVVTSRPEFRGKQVGMEVALRELGLPLDGWHHSGIDDCRNTSKIVRELMRAGPLRPTRFPHNRFF